MSQSRARKPHSVGVDCPKGRPSVVKASGDSAPCPPTQPKQHRSKNKIPKSIRYDLENALVGLCDVWFEDIKPHLVRNKIKLHVESGGAAARGDCGRLPRASPGCSHLDPGAASDLLQLACANSAGCCSTQRKASRPRCRRPPALRPPPSPPPPLYSSPTPVLSTSQNKNRKNKLLRRTTARQKPQTPNATTSNTRVPRLCRTYSLQSPQSSPKSRRQRVKTASTVPYQKEPSCLLSIVPRLRTNTRNKYTQTETPCKIKLEHRDSMKRTNTDPISSNAKKIPNVRHKHTINLIDTELSPPRNRQASTRGSIDKRSNTGTYPLVTNTCQFQQRFNTHTKMRREVSETMDLDSVPSKTICPQKQLKKKPNLDKPVASTHQHRSRQNRPSRSSASEKLVAQEKGGVASVAQKARQIEGKRSTSHLPQQNPSPVAEPNSHQFWRSYATTNLITLKNKNEGPKKPSVLFEKELIDIIGSSNDNRLRVLYKNAAQVEFPSVMNLVLSPGDRTREASCMKTQPWR